MSITNNKGSITVSMLIVLFITGVLGFSFLSVSSYESESYKNHYNELYMLSKAEAAISKAVALIRSQKFENDYSGKAWEETILPYNDEDPFLVNYKIYGEFKDSVKAVVFRNGDINFVDTMLILRSLVKPKFANEYFMLFNDPGKPYFLSGDTIDGKIHSNSYIKTAGTPYFTDVIELNSNNGNGIEKYSHYKGNPHYNKPELINWNSGVFDLSNQADNIKHGADKFFSNPGSVAEVNFRGDQLSIRYRGKNVEGVYTSPKTYPLSSFSSLYFEQDVEVRGVLSGKMTIGSRGSIIITDDVVYEGSHPKTGKPAEGSESMLGLIAQKNVLVNKDHKKAAADGGIRVNASIVALDSSMSTKNLYHQNMGIFNLWGSITERVRGVNAVSRDDQVVFGYKKSWHYDQRLRNETPPRFTPIKNSDGIIKYKVTGWNRKY